MYTNPRLSLAAVVVAGIFATGCSQQQVDGGSSQVAGSSQQVAGSSQQVAGSSQQVAGSSQQVAGSSQQVAGGTQQQQAKPAPVQKPAPVRKPAPIRKPVVITRPAPRPAPRPVAPRRNPNEHRHPAVPRCTNSVTHIHPNGARTHNHKYSCKGNARRPAYRPRPRPTPRRANRWTHRHAAIPRCTDSITHTHKYGVRNHSHKYSCQRPAARRYVAAKPRGNQVNVHALQRKLKAKGYYRGPINGVVTPNTRSALQRYMQNRR